MESTQITNAPKDSQEKTVFSLLSQLNNKPSNDHSKSPNDNEQESDDVLIIRRNSKTNQNTINKSVYLKLHKSSTSNDFIDKIKGKFETSDTHIKISEVNQRALKTQSQIIPKSVISNDRHSLFLPNNRIRSEEINRKDNLALEDEYVTIIPRSDSEESVSKIKAELSIFTMERNKKSKGFRKLFSVFSNKDKKKNSDEKTKSHCRNVNDNFHIETNNINRQALYRQTIPGSGPSSMRPMGTSLLQVQRYDNVPKVSSSNYNEQQVEILANNYNKTKQSFENQEVYSNSMRNAYTPAINNSNIKPMNSNVTYINVPNTKKIVDTSSSASTLASEKCNFYHNETHLNPYQYRTFNTTNRDTPPRLLETKQEVHLVNPKSYTSARSPNRSPLNVCVADNYNNTVNSLETLNITDTADNFNQKTDPKLNKNILSRSHMNSPSSPSLEPSKLKLPPNRDIVPLSPRVRSPIPLECISTEKLIATELLKTNKSPTLVKKNIEDNIEVSNISKYDKEKDYIINSNQYVSKNINYPSSKPPVAPTMQKYSNNIQEQNKVYGSTCKLGNNNESIYNSVMGPKQYIPSNNSDRVTTNAMVHMSSPVNKTPTPSNSFQNLSFSPTKQLIRPSTPSDSRIPESPSSTPQKQDIRRSVEAYYWKEIKKMKDKENYNLYMMQLQYGNLFPQLYAAESANNIRRSRSLSPQTSRNGRRSLSLPQEMRPQQQNHIYHTNAIPENHAVHHGPISVQQLQHQQQQQQKYFNRNSRERNTIDSATIRSNKGTSRPIIKRGSLSSPPQPTVVDDSLKRKVSFSGSRNQNQVTYAWSADKQRSLDNDEVFLSNAEYRQLCLANSTRNTSKEDIYYKASYPMYQRNYVGKPQQNPNAIYATRQQFVTSENIYGRTPSNYSPCNYVDEGFYRQPIDAIQSRALPRLTRHGSIQGHNEELRRQQSNNDNEKNSYPNNNIPKRNMSNRSSSESNYPNYNWSLSKQLPEKRSPFLRREIILQDDIYGRFGGYIEGVNNKSAISQQSPSVSRHVSVSNKICDIYGQIHDADNSNVQQKGVIMGQLNSSNNNYRMNREPPSFQRNNRLTASANDMNRRLCSPLIQQENTYGRIENAPKRYSSHQPPDRPLPAIPGTPMKRNDIISDTESGSETTNSELQSIINNNNKGKFDNRHNNHNNMLVK